MNTLLSVSLAIVILFAVYALYFLFYAFKDEESKNTDDNGHYRYFAILIPARNEESVIGSLLDSIGGLSYPEGLFETYVLVNGCTDRTKEIAASFKASVLECESDIRTKGAVLETAFRQLRKNRKIDAYAIVDADNTVDPSFLAELNRALNAAKVVQGKRAGSSTVTWIAQCYEIFYAFVNSFFNAPGNRKDRTATINGSGWAVSKELIDSLDFHMDTITEDYEFSIICALNDEKIVYCEKAAVYDRFPADFRTSLIQRIRWSFGIVQCFREYLGKLIRKALKGSVSCFDIAMTCIMALFIACFMVALYVSVSLLLSAFPFYVIIAAILLAFWLPVSAFAVIAVWKNGEDLREMKKGILCFPLFIISWFPILVYCLFLKECKWTQLRH